MKLTDGERVEIIAKGRRAGLRSDGSFTGPFFDDDYQERFEAWLEGYRVGEQERCGDQEKR